jgi:serine/threonine protein kinase
MVPAHDTASVLALRGERHLVLGQEIGRGSQGVVYVGRLEHPGVMARHVAVKVIDAAIAHDEGSLHELTRSVRRSSLVRHPNVVQITDYFMVDGSPYIIQDLVEGMSLASFVARWDAVGRRIPLDLALFIACEVAEGLAGARSTQGIDGTVLHLAHHDLSPRQVLLSWFGEVRVADFGRRTGGDIASGIRRTEKDVRPRVAYMAPEVAHGARGDARSDVFSLGVMLHEMLYGPRFAPDASAREVLVLTREGLVPKPIIAPVLPPKIAEVLDRALEVDPRERQAHAGVMAYDLRREALALGVGDERMFLRSALFEMSEGPEKGVGHDTDA